MFITLMVFFMLLLAPLYLFKWFNAGTKLKASKITDVTTKKKHFENFIESLKSSGKYDEVKSRMDCYKREKNVEEMFKCIWELEETHHHLVVNMPCAGKSETLSETLRKDGNKSYKKKHISDALELYNLSIMAAPHPLCLNGKIECSNDTNKCCSGSEAASNGVETTYDGLNPDFVPKYNALSLGYANRSAVLLELKQHEKCISDINRAIQLGYPKLNQCKILERKAKCYIALNKPQQARTILEEYLNTVGNSNIDSQKCTDINVSIRKLINECNKHDILNEESVNHTKKIFSDIRKMSSLTNDELIFEYNTPPPPLLTAKNANIPSLCDGLKVHYTPHQGRFIVATRDIKPGEVLAVEPGYVTAVNIKDPHALQTFCFLCLQRTAAPLPCPECAMVVFCSEKCRVDGWNKYHRVECPLLAEISALKFPCFQAFRILIQIPYPKLKDLVSKLQQDAKRKTRKLQGFNENSVYDSSDYRTAYFLEGNIEKRKAIHLIELCAMSFMLTKMLLKSERYLKDSSGKSFEVSKTDILFIGSTLLTHLTGVACNSCELIELQMNVENTQSNDLKHVGSGIFPATCLFNHSCNPSAMGFSNGNYNVCHAVRFIRAGMEVKVTYGKLYYMDERDERRADLLKDYFFTCSCKACINDWKMDDSYPRLRSNNPMPGKFSKKVHRKSSVQYTSEKIELLEDQLKSIITKFQATKSKIESRRDDTKLHMKTLIDTIEFFDRFVEMPTTIYQQAQETLADCLMEKRACTYFRD
ncbi:unnamed protein product [Meganyctiphanes norvegica]|uniref:Protein-lysine N-methyltransferase SMYD4 n=1 Tax=Meganyctiphanes norvegica TaxID=48144 RepID=A0AAV2PKA6_MEGNR